MPPFLRFVIRRLAILVLLCLGITFVAFTLTQLVPGDPARAYLGQYADLDPKAIQAFRERNGLDEPLPVQYALYVRRLVQGDLGESQQSHRPVRDDLSEYVPATAELAIAAMVIALLLGVPLGLAAALRRDRGTDQALRVASLVGMSMPTFWLALLGLYVFFLKLGLAPGSGRLSPGVPAPGTITGFFTIDSLLAGDLATFRDVLGHLVLPACVLAAPLVALLMRFTRAAVLDVAGNDHVLNARAKGLKESTIVVRHILRAALPPIVTVAGVLLASALAGTIVVEQIFGWPGIGRYLYMSSTTLDRPAIMGASLFIAVAYAGVNFLVDVLYRVIDPRMGFS